MFLRKITVLLVFLFMGLPGFSWRLMDGFVRGAFADRVPLVSRLVRGETLPYFVHIRGPWDPQKLDEIFTRSFNSWRIYTLQDIREAKREKGFKDIVKKLQTPWKFEMRPYLSCADFEQTPWQELSRPVVVADLPEYMDMYPAPCSSAVQKNMDDYRQEVQSSFYSAYDKNLNKEQSHSLPGRYISWEAVGQPQSVGFGRVRVYTDLSINTLVVPLAYQDSLFHEMGHLLGFSDQYPSYEDREDSLEYGLSGYWPSIMQDGLETESWAYFSCTDADGMINLLDLLNHKSRDGKKGWKTLCSKEKIQYANSRQLARPPFVAPPYVYFYSKEGNLLYSRKEALDVYSPLQLPRIPDNLDMDKWDRHADGSAELHAASDIFYYFFYTPISVSVFGENIMKDEVFTVFTLIFLPYDFNVVYWKDPWYGASNPDEIELNAVLGEAKLNLKWTPVTNTLRLSALPRAYSADDETVASTFTATVPEEGEELVATAWRDNATYPEYDTYLKSALKLMGSELDDKYLRKDSYIMSLLSLLGKGVDNMDWNKIGLGLIIRMRSSGLGDAWSYTVPLQNSLPQFFQIGKILDREVWITDSWPEVLAAGNLQEWLKKENDEDEALDEKWRKEHWICPKGQANFYPENEELAASVQCAQYRGEPECSYTTIEEGRRFCCEEWSDQSVLCTEY